MKKLIVIVLVAVFSMQIVNAQDSEMEELKESPISFTANLQTNHLWRGLIITDKPMVAVMTTLRLDKSGSFTTGIWGGMSFSNESDGTHYKEINYYVQYAASGFSIGVWNLFNTRGVDDPDVWDYDQETTGHLIDLRTSYTFGKKFPLRLEADVLLYGRNDAEFDMGDIEQRYSTYVEVSYPFVNNTKVDLSGFVGAGIALNGDTHLYGDGQESFDLVNVGFKATKVVKLAEMNIPVSATTLWNPSQKMARVQLAITIL